ncbi:alpha/beta hydrolase family protein [Micromonospora sp. 067-2]|uniref:alpha/beta hydrolase family protein n=1 Tax=Micromonospora sp. 067-2 TaxID=2789270 RepID=UPI00397BB723
MNPPWTTGAAPARAVSRRRLLTGLGAATVAAGVGALGRPAPATADHAAAAVLFSVVSTFPSSVGGDPADVYHPVTSRRHTPWPVVLLLQGANVDKANYRAVARRVAAYGFVVVVPNHQRVIAGRAGLFVVGEQAGWTVDWAAGINSSPGSPLRGRVDADSLLLIGHSFGGATALSLSTGLCTPPFSDAPLPAPRQLRAIACYGTNNAAPGGSGVTPIANTVPIALIQGSTDGIAEPADGLATYEAITAPPKLYAELKGANHYGITDTQQPAGAIPDPSPEALHQSVAVAKVARWSALWLRAQLGDPVGRAWVSGLGDLVDTDVTTRYRVQL